MESEHCESENEMIESPGLEAGNKHLEEFSAEDKKMIQLMADIIVQAVLNS